MQKYIVISKQTIILKYFENNALHSKIIKTSLSEFLRINGILR